MKRLLLTLVLSAFCSIRIAHTAVSNEKGVFSRISQRWQQIWNESKATLILSGYAWHNRYTYSSEKIKTYNELAYGGGFAKDFFDEKGNEHAIYLITFLDSHTNPEPVLGYAYIKTAHFSKKVSMGLGYTVLITMRPDINKGGPFPGILPWATFNYGRASLMATYIPGSSNVGNVLLLLGKISLD